MFTKDYSGFNLQAVQQTAFAGVTSISETTNFETNMFANTHSGVYEPGEAKIASMEFNLAITKKNYR